MAFDEGIGPQRRRPTCGVGGGDGRMESKTASFIPVGSDRPLHTHVGRVITCCCTW